MVPSVALRTWRGHDAQVTSSAVVEGQLTVHWLDTRHRRNLFTGDGVEISADPRLKKTGGDEKP
jgi:hypothetical protein